MIKADKAKAVLAKATCLYDHAEVEQALDCMAAEITVRLAGTHPLILTVMTGGLYISAALTLRMRFPLEIDYLHVSRYQGQIRPGDLHWRVEPRIPVKSRTVLIIDDVLDGGLTFGAIVDYCHSQGAKKVYTAVLADKDHPRDPGGLEKADFTGVHVEDRYLFGYGLDYDENLRNVPGIYAIADEHR